MISPPKHNLIENPNVIFPHLPEPAYLAIADVKTYPSFVNSHWTLQSLYGHLLEQMKKQTLCVCGCPTEDLKIRIRFTPAREVKGQYREYCEMTSSRLSTSGLLCFASHSHFSFCASNKRQQLTGQDPIDEKFVVQVFQVPPGEYDIQIYRHFEWDGESAYADDAAAVKVHCTFEFLPPTSNALLISNIPWLTKWQS